MSHAATLPVLLKGLKLSAIAAHWEEYLDHAEQRGWNPAQYLAALCEEETNERYSRRIARYLKESKLPVGNSLSSFDFTHLPEMNAGKIEVLASDPELG
jgi:DNA replication protein DnaC